jgi:hypothetical protein
VNPRNPSDIYFLLPSRYTKDNPEIEICTSTTLVQTATAPLVTPDPSSAEVLSALLVLGQFPVESWRKNTSFFFAKSYQVQKKHPGKRREKYGPGRLTSESNSEAQLSKDN